MAHLDPIDLAAIDGVSDPVQRLADDAVAAPHAGCLQRFDNQISHSLAHCGTTRFACVPLSLEVGRKHCSTHPPDGGVRSCCSGEAWVRR
jgi:hypothetical protein